MKIGRLIAATLILAALAATLYWANRRQQAEDAARLLRDAPVKVLSLNKDDISRVEIKKKGGDDVVLSKSGPQNWKITSPKSLIADQDQISSVLAALSPVDANGVIAEKANDLKPYGLTEPILKVSATVKDGKPQNLLIGDDTPTGDSAYAMLEGDPRLFTISISTKTSLDKGVKDLQDKHLLPVDFEKISRVEITSPKLNLAFGSDNGQWVIQNPKDVRGDTSKLEGVVEQLRTATMDPGMKDQERKKAASSFSSGTPLATVKVTDQSGSQELQVRKNKDAYYAKTTAMEGAYKVSNGLGDAINKNLDDFREKRLFDFAADNPEKIEMHSGAKSYFLTRSGEDWWSDGKKMDPVSVDSFIRAIRLLSAAKFVGSGFSTSAATLTVTSMDGKRVEKVLISKNGSRYVAKRENEPLLYEVEAKGFEDLVKSADEMKVAEPAKQ
ncbi:MAG: DUF4340 domain-containing protein [Acidobacteriia bacterium]|nr:DUF4340 domain-containing protein [Terriglobia bacterium]